MAGTEEALQQTLNAVEEEFGEEAIQKLDDEDTKDIDTISTGSLKLDDALGVGGIPRGRITEIYGPESCLAPDTFIQYEIRKPNGDRVNHKGGSVERLYHRFNGLPTGDGRVDRHAADDYVFYAPSMNGKGRIVQNKIRGVVYTGRQTVYQVVTKSGNTIEATEEHRFFVGDGFERLKNLEEGSSVYIHNNTPYRVGEYDYENHKDWYVKDHPNEELPTKIVDGKYEYVRLQEGRAVLEAEANGLTPEEYRARLNNGDVDGLEYIPTTLDIHHKDRNPKNNDPSNLVALSPQEHNKIHALENEDKLRFMVIEDEITSIKRIGVKETYDIKMAAPHHNFVAEGVVVHNSGKTTLATHVIAEAQKEGGTCAFIDAEHAFDPGYAENIGVNVEDLFVSQPDNGERALGIADALVRGGAFDVIVVDSVSALVPQAELEGDMGDAHIGLQARLMSQALRKLTGTMNRTKTAFIFINQIRMKVGVQFGNPETTSGGRALRFYSSVRLDIRRIGAVKDSDDNVIGNQTRVRVKKNKVASPFKKAEFEIIYGQGISRLGEIVDLATKHGIIDKKGSWYKRDGDTLAQGHKNTKHWLRENPEQRKEIISLIKEKE